MADALDSQHTKSSITSAGLARTVSSSDTGTICVVLTPPWTTSTEVGPEPTSENTQTSPARSTTTADGGTVTTSRAWAASRSPTPSGEDIARKTLVASSPSTEPLPQM